MWGCLSFIGGQAEKGFEIRPKPSRNLDAFFDLCKYLDSEKRQDRFSVPHYAVRWKEQVVLL